MEYAGFWRRLAAWFVDWMILLVPNIIIATQMGVWSGYALSLAMGWLYFAGLESSGWQATPGKRLLGIHVCTFDGERLTFVRASARWLAKIPSGLIFGIGYLMIAFSENKEGLHDVIASTNVKYDTEPQWNLGEPNLTINAPFLR